MDVHRKSLDTLPVELVYEIQFLALSETLPHACKRLFHIFKFAPPTVQAEYIIGRHFLFQSGAGNTSIITRALRYPLCTRDVLDALCRHSRFPQCLSLLPELPRRLFQAMKTPGGVWRDRHEPLPFLRYLYGHPRIPAPDSNSHGGYPLSHAVRAGFVPLVQFLLDHGASPRRKDDMAVMLAIQQRDLAMVKLLIEPSAVGTDEGMGRKGKGKRRRMVDRVEVSQRMLRMAVKHKANDIVDYLMKEKRCIPDLQTLRLIR